MASYTIKTRIYQTKPSAYFQVVEKTAFYYTSLCYWKPEAPTVDTLVMGNSGTSGTLRFITETDNQSLFVTLGFHNYKPWVDIVGNQSESTTCVVLLPQYYDGNHADRTKAREAQRTTWSATDNKGRKVTATYRSGEGNHLELDIIFE